jgi:SPOR domain
LHLCHVTYMKHSIIISIIALLLANCFFSRAHAQTDSGKSVVMIYDSRLDDLTKKQYQLNKSTNDVSALSKYKTSGGKYKGFRVMVLNTNDREKAYQTRGQLATRFPQHALYLGYQAPYYKLKMGDFLEKSDAEALKRQLAGFIKQGVFIVPEAINLKPEDEEKLIEKLTKGSDN